MKIDCIWHGNNQLGECPVWDTIHQSLFWIDATKPAIHKMDMVSAQHQWWEMPALIGSIALCDNDQLIAAIGEGFALFDPDQGVISPQTKVIKNINQTHLNDGKCDRLGRFWAGSVSHDTNRALGKLYCYSSDKKVSIKQQQVNVSNGLGWGIDNEIFYYTDSKEQSIYQFDFDLKNARLSNKKLFYKASAPNETPDGLTVDAEGYVWSAIWNGGKVIRLNPQGEIDLSIDLPVSRPTSCCFGGENLMTLFITSCSIDIGETQALNEPLAGNVFAIKLTNIKGVAESAFKLDPPAVS